MATPKFDRISVLMAQKINDPVAAAANDGNLTAAARTAYVNNALLKTVNDVWASVKGDVSEFANIFPELVDNRDVTFTSGNYVIANPNLDYIALVAVLFTGPVLAEILPPNLFAVVSGGKISQMSGSATKPICIETNKTIYAFPAASFSNTAATITIIKAPLNPTDGSFLTQGGSYDSPFHDKWNDKIAEIAAQLWRQDVGE